MLALRFKRRFEICGTSSTVLCCVSNEERFLMKLNLIPQDGLTVSQTYDQTIRGWFPPETIDVNDINSNAASDSDDSDELIISGVDHTSEPRSFSPIQLAKQLNKERKSVWGDHYTSTRTAQSAKDLRENSPGVMAPDPLTHASLMAIDKAEKTGWTDQAASIGSQDSIECASSPKRRSSRIKARSEGKESSFPQYDMSAKKFGSPLQYKFDHRWYRVSGEDASKLSEGELLNDEIINFTLRYYLDQEEQKNPTMKGQVHLFSSFFYSTYWRKDQDGKRFNYANIKNWTNKVDLFRTKYVIIPVNEKSHWYVVVICNLSTLLDKAAASKEDADCKIDSKHSSSRYFTADDPLILVFDSLGIGHQNIYRPIRQYIYEEAKARKGVEIDTDDICGRKVPVPRQDNFSDCGVYLLHYMEVFLSKPRQILDVLMNKEHTSRMIQAGLMNLWDPSSVLTKRKQIWDLLLHLKESQPEIPDTVDSSSEEEDIQEVHPDTFISKSIDRSEESEADSRNEDSHNERESDKTDSQDSQRSEEVAGDNDKPESSESDDERASSKKRSESESDEPMPCSEPMANDDNDDTIMGESAGYTNDEDMASESGGSKYVTDGDATPVPETSDSDDFNGGSEYASSAGLLSQNLNSLKQFVASVVAPSSSQTTDSSEKHAMGYE
ncbi:hypothetical protein CANCADRAFT_46310 [Tortispora caseinolytica NRRL Y-17796]|uniref:Ubiquitin-like protease family profile domain-containing protein n=1 Tax=Tortispora caseinolytica NRRL Y-17796 TaxID=767744 RepID=A0A1E4T9J5_9ASCO|nr:hypothetical protein CANCADRAFT_46310 [Tortispora caseinolytica NRRL Y-17796]